MTLAYDKPTFRVFAIVDAKYSANSKEPMHVTDPDKTAEQLAPLLHADKQMIADRLKEGKEKGKDQVEFGKVGRGLSQKTKQKIEKLKLPGIGFIKESTRFYPNGTFASQIIGFARDTEKQRKMDSQGILSVLRVWKSKWTNFYMVKKAIFLMSGIITIVNC
ncbi:hypothetical protein P5G51_011740 [Virgibacillus sp. 179-BFC.A HS]|uniref:serine-type D-Ala-D-Ala carboxypeptidase n=1 Tax=Tigheibacillus jepli TaxID=3035914 RepID=A0ABU5CKC0_9BACI|nr:hypothetical protein [Virgibacillus sp. 179-BFC.A HS]MDY0405968.1 hypothetical protein [Virgibacillus sp. 179-BFC.A HS]